MALIRKYNGAKDHADRYVYQDGEDGIESEKKSENGIDSAYGGGKQNARSTYPSVERARADVQTEIIHAEVDQKQQIGVDVLLHKDSFALVFVYLIIL